MGDNDQSKLFVGGITRETTEDTLREYFGKYGAVVNSVIARDRETGNPRGFGFVSFSDSSAVELALQHTHVILERTVEVKKAIPRSEQHHNKGFARNNGGIGCRSTDEFRTKKIFVGGLAASLTEEEFRGYFAKFGGITDVVVMHDNVTNRPRGFGFITFDSEDAVEDVMQKSFHELTGKLVEVKRAVPKDGSNCNYNNHSHNGNGYNTRAGSRRDNFDNYQGGNHQSPYSPQCGVLPGYGPLFGYGGSMGYPYGPNIFAGGFPMGGYNGIGYGVAPLAPRSPWNGPAVLGVRGSPLPYGNVPNVYPAFLNGGVGVMGMTATNGHNGIEGMGVNGHLSQVCSSDEQVAVGMTPEMNGVTVKMNSLDMGGSDGSNGEVATDMASAQMKGGTVKPNSLDMDGSDGAASSQQNEEGSEGKSRLSPVGTSS